MCTVCVWADNDKATLSSRNMDWFEDMPTDLWVIPAGRIEDGHASNDPNPITWQSRYGSISAVCYGMGSADGINEAGLAASLLWLAESDYGERDLSVPGLGLALWAQYYLDLFGTVQEAVEAFEQNPYQLLPADVAGRQATVHLQLSDSTGDCAVLEVLAGEVVIHHSPEFRVLTNSPSFTEQLTNLRHYHGFGGDQKLPGTTEAADRFVRAAFYLNSLKDPADTTEAIAELLSVLRNTAQPYGEPDPLRPNVSPTRWRTLRDHTNLRFFFESTASPYLIWLDGAKVDFSADASPQVLHLENMADRIGEQSALLQDEPLPTFG